MGRAAEEMTKGKKKREEGEETEKRDRQTKTVTPLTHIQDSQEHNNKSVAQLHGLFLKSRKKAKHVLLSSVC